MDVQAAVINLKPGSLERVRAWAATINRRKAEALETLDNEGVDIESWFLFSMHGNDYLICYMRAHDMKAAHQAVQQSLHAIDAYHQQFKKDTWASGELAELLVDLNALEPRPSHNSSTTTGTTSTS